jgi:low temperature requirement protein LtrA
MLLRDPGEEGRTAANLELFFDLVFVVTISAIAGQWHHAIAGADVASGMVSLAVVMFGGRPQPVHGDVAAAGHLTGCER